MPAPTAQPVAFDAALRADLARVQQVVEGGAASPVLLDTRGPKSFAGEEKSSLAKRAGRLPGALHLETAAAYDSAANRLRPRPELEALAAALPEGPVITYCNTGQLASTGWFVLSELLGRPGVAMYDGSMSEWTQDPARPVETGPAKDASQPA
jgi:thiosulfate/3-mercaptopyruvate sulfurtransferase